MNSPVNPLVHTVDPVFRFGPVVWRDDGTCSYCGSMTVAEAIRRLSTPGGKFSGSDQKYGYPHKFRFDDGKFYTRHLLGGSPGEVKRFAELSRKCLGIDWWVDDEKGLGYAQPGTQSFYGWQTWGTLGEDGEPVFGDGSPRPPPAAFWKT